MTPPTGRSSNRPARSGYEQWLATPDEVQGFLEGFTKVGNTALGSEVRMGAISSRQGGNHSQTWMFYRELALTISAGLMVAVIHPEDGLVQARLHKSGDCVLTCGTFAAWQPDEAPQMHGPARPGIDLSVAEGERPDDRIMRLPAFVNIHEIERVGAGVMDAAFAMLQRDGHRLPALVEAPSAVAPQT